jgi:hypothetical protein
MRLVAGLDAGRFTVHEPCARIRADTIERRVGRRSAHGLTIAHLATTRRRPGGDQAATRQKKSAARDYPAALESVTGGELGGEQFARRVRDLVIYDCRTVLNVSVIRIRAGRLKRMSRAIE